MYSKIKKIIIASIGLLLIAGGVWFAEKYRDQMFQGYREVIFVEKGSLDFEKQIEEIAAEYNAVIVKRIIQPNPDGSGNSIYTYVPIGSGMVPESMVLQEDQELIQNSSDETVYVITSGNLSAAMLASLLRENGNEVYVLPTDYSFAYLKTVVSRVEILLLLLVILIALGTLILGEYITELKETGIRRLAGEGKYSIAFQKCAKDIRFMVLVTAVLLIVLFAVLNIMNIFTIQTYTMILIALLIWSLIVLILDVSLSVLYYHLLQKQPLILSIKGKAPLKMIIATVVFTQILSLAALMVSARRVEIINDDLRIYENAKSVWQKYPDYAQMQGQVSGSEVTEEQIKAFERELVQQEGLIYRKFDFYLTDQQLKNPASYLPNPWMIVNAIWVNAQFLKQSQVELSAQDWQIIDQLGEYDRHILLPSSLNDENEEVKSAWLQFEKTAGEANRSEEDQNAEVQVTSSVYEDSHPVFTYAVYTPSIQPTMNFLNSPVIIVENNNLQYADPSSVLTADAQKTEQLIREHGVAEAYGSFTNGLYSINEKIGDTKISQAILAAGAVCSLICSFMLIFLLNLIYFYQGRRQFFIERLAGKSLLEIHRKYLLITSAGCILISLAAVILGAGWKTGVIPLIYCLVLYLLFWLQMKKEQEANILYLKGE